MKSVVMMRRNHFPKWTRWRPMQDWAWNANESKFYNEIFHPASACSKEQNAFPFTRWDEMWRRATSKKGKQSFCARYGSSQLEVITLFIRKNWVKLRWKFDFRREEKSREEKWKTRNEHKKIFSSQACIRWKWNYRVPFPPLMSLEWKFYVKLRVVFNVSPFIASVERVFKFDFHLFIMIHQEVLKSVNR